MIYINADTTSVVMPKYSPLIPTHLVLKNNLTNVIYTFEVEDKTHSFSFYTFDIDPSDLIVGEYTYEIKDNDVVLSQGLIQFGEYDRTKTEYDKNNDIIVYNG